MLSVNEVIRMVSYDPAPLFTGFVRFLGVNKNGNAAFVRLDIMDKSDDGSDVLNFEKLKAPFQIPFNLVTSGIQEGRILTDQSFKIPLPQSTGSLSKSERKRLDNVLEILKPLLDKSDVLFDESLRKRIFEDQSGKHEVSERYIRRYYYRYLWGGQTEDALVSHYNLCGGKGGQQRLGTKKRGRKRKDGSTGPALPEICVFRSIATGIPI